MSRTSHAPPRAARVLANPRALQAPLVLAACWAGLEVLFTLVAGDQGLLAPFAPVNLGALALGLTLLGLRLVGTLLLLPWSVWRLTSTRPLSGAQAASDQTSGLTKAG